MILPPGLIVATIWGAAVEYEWDEAKRHSNLAKHGVDFSSLAAFEWESSWETEDTRKDYGERRWISLGRIGQLVHVLIYTRRGMRVRVISLLVANRKELEGYEANAQAANGRRVSGDSARHRP